MCKSRATHRALITCYMWPLEHPYFSHLYDSTWNKSQGAVGLDPKPVTLDLGWLVACLTSQQHASVSQRRICSHNCTRCRTQIQVADQTFHLTQSQYTDTGPTSPRADPITPGAWQGSHWGAIFLSHWHDSTRNNPGASGFRTPNLPLSWRTP